MKKILLGSLLIASVFLTGCFEGDGSCGGGSSKPSQQEVT
tara:strand:+ start:203 stop:322 length:120 start_codon:yes stop_codon:yes gene_type:complete